MSNDTCVEYAAMVRWRRLGISRPKDCRWHIKSLAANATYWEALKAALTDLEITDDELEQLVEKERTLGLHPEQVRMLHARAFMGVISQFVSDTWLDPREQRVLKRLHHCLSHLGWAPGE